jgi:two-component system, sensor histidine kinase and response regulator
MIQAQEQEREPQSRPLALVIEDNLESREVFSEALRLRGFKVVAAGDGFSGYKLALELLPEVIVLDVMLPEIDGIRLCRQLKKHPAAGRIPVIFISSLASDDEIRRGLEAGGADYIVKPVRVEQFLARVAAQVRLARLERDRDRAAQDRLTAGHWEAVKTITEGLAHNFNNILTSALGNLQMLIMDLTDPAQREAATDTRQALEQAASLVRLMQHYHSLSPDPRPLNVKDLMVEEVDLFRSVLPPEVEFTVSLPPCLPDLAPGAGPYLRQALRVALANAAEAVGAKGRISLRAEPPGRSRAVALRIDDTGHGISPEAVAKAFLPFFSTKNTVGVGLGLYSARLALELIGGTIDIENRRESQGARVKIVVPVEKISPPT